MANPSNDKGGSPAPARRSRTKRDPRGDKVYRVPPQDFADTVQRLTGAAVAAGQSSQSQQAPAPVVAGAADGASSSRQRPSSSSSGGSPPPAPALLSVSRTARSRSMQDAYLAWCASNNVVLSPGTMAEMDRGVQS